MSTATNFTEVDFLHAMLEIKDQIIEIVKKQQPIKIPGGGMAHPVDDGGLSEKQADLKHLERSLELLKNYKERKLSQTLAFCKKSQ